MRVLLTGSDGYIGILLGTFLVERGYEVMGLDTGFYREGWLYDGVKNIPTTITKDIRSLESEDLKGFDSVVHLAELSNDPLGQLNPANTFDINFNGSMHLATLAKEVGIRRFIYTSSCSVYGIGTGEYKDEQSDVNPQTTYASCKVLVEQGLSTLADDDFSPTFLRNATAYGASPRMRFDIVLNNLAGIAWTVGEIRMTSDGTPWRPLVHVLDICEAIACTLEAPQESIHNEIFNVGNTDENFQIRDIADIVLNVIEGCEISLGESGGDNRSYRVNCDKIASNLPGFKTHRSAEKGAKQLRDLFKQITLTHDLFKSRAYTRILQLEYLIRTEQLDNNLFWI